MEKINKLSLPTTIIVASIILGGFYYASEISKQGSIERQQTIKIEQENQRDLSLQLCLDEADAKYKKSVQYWLNLEDKVGTDNVLKSVDKEKVIKQQDIDECYRRYKQ